MDPKYKTLIPLVVIFFIIGIVVGYAAHKPETIVKKEYVENKTIVTVTVTVTPIPIPTLTPALIPTSTVAATPEISYFTIKNYDPSTDITKYTINLRNWAADPPTLSIRPGDTVLIKISDTYVPSPLTIILNNTEKRYLGTSGAVIVTFNKKGTFGLKVMLSSDDPNIIARTYAEGTITVY